MIVVKKRQQCFCHHLKYVNNLRTVRKPFISIKTHWMSAVWCQHWVLRRVREWLCSVWRGQSIISVSCRHLSNISIWLFVFPPAHYVVWVGGGRWGWAAPARHVSPAPPLVPPVPTAAHLQHEWMGSCSSVPVGLRINSVFSQFLLYSCKMSSCFLHRWSAAIHSSPGSRLASTPMW